MRCLFFYTVWLLIALPTSAHAATVTTWDLTTDFARQGWQANTNVQMSQTAAGIRLQPQSAEGTLRRVVDVSHNIDAARLWYSTPVDTEVFIMWANRNSGESMYKSPLQLAGGPDVRIWEIDFEQFDTWDYEPTIFGVLLPNGADVTLQNIEFIRYSPTEKLAALLQGLWQFDDIGPYSINFLWGPRWSQNPIQTTQIFWVKPPAATSANWLMYGVLGVGALYIWLRKKSVQTFLVLLACVWIAYDIRMGAEFLSYTYDDYQSYHSQQIGQRTFRERLFFNDLAEVVSPVVQSHDKYIFLSGERWPYLGLIRYYTYPSLPTTPFDGNSTKYPLWIVYQRPDITLNASQQLVANGQVLSPPGRMLHEFANGSFIFQTEL